jgi:uncharacterized membrane protein HdeD (DUF308 family)
MFIRLNFMNRISEMLPDSWMDALVTGVTLIMTGLMIFIFPAILAYLIAGMLIWGGSILFYTSFKIRNLKREYIRWQQDERIW